MANYFDETMRCARFEKSEENGLSLGGASLQTRKVHCSNAHDSRVAV
jgi:hypothetical protein